MLQRIYQRHSLKILLLTAFTVPLFAYGAWQAIEHKHNDVQDWLPGNSPATKDYQWFRHHFQSDQFILVSWDGCTLDDPRVGELASRVLADDEAGHFRDVRTALAVREELLADQGLRVDLNELAKRLKGTLVGPDGDHTCVIFLLSERGEKNYRRAIESIRRAAVEHCGIPADTIHMAGAPIENRALDAEGEWALAKVAGLAAIVGLLLAWRFLGNWRLTIASFFIACYAAAISLAVVWFSGGHVDAFQLTMPLVVYVLMLSAAIHLINYYGDARAKVGAARAAAEAVQRGWLPCVLAAGTTALGLVSLMTSQLLSVRWFGLYTAIGVMAAAGLLLAFLPAALQRWPGALAPTSRAPTSLLSSWRDRLTNTMIRRHGWVSAGMLLLLGVSAAGLYRVGPTLDLLKQFSPRSRIVQDYGWLERKLGPLSAVEVVIRWDDPTFLPSFADRYEAVSRMHDAIGELDDVGGVTSLATFLPPPPERRQQNWASRLAYDAEIDKRIQQVIDTNYLRRPGEESPELWRVSARLWTTSSALGSPIVEKIRRQVGPALAWTGDHEDKINVTYTGTAVLLGEAQRELLRGLIKSLALAFVLIGLAMVAVLRSPSAGLVGMLPNVFPVAVIFGWMGWLNVDVDMGSMITATVAMGVAVDDTIHMLTWYRRGLDQGLDRPAAIRSACRMCGIAMFQTTAIAGVGLLAFALSSFTPTRQFGLMMFLLLTAALAGDLLLLPALLAGPAGRFFGRSKRRHQEPAH